jgi:PTH1 family peptidyl-tRNA hydrolase
MSENNLDKLFDALRGIISSPETQEDSNRPEKQVLAGETFLIVGLGNPGKEYRNTRHNIGFMVVDRLGSKFGSDFTRAQSKALITDFRHQGQRIYLAKPQTFMNASGQALAALVRFYKIHLNNLMVVYDDVDLPFETIRIKPSGGSAGHRGMNNIIQQLGSKEFPRLRMGVGRSFGSKQAADYVLKPFSREESEFLNNYIDRASDAVLAFIEEGLQPAMTKYNRLEK